MIVYLRNFFTISLLAIYLIYPIQASNEVDEVYLPYGKKLTYNGKEITYAMAPQVYDYVFKKKGNAAVFQLIYKENQSEEIKNFYISTNQSVITAYKVTWEYPDEGNIKQTQQIAAYPNDKNVLDVFGKRGLVRADQEDSSYLLDDKLSSNFYRIRSNAFEAENKYKTLMNGSIELVSYWDRVKGSFYWKEKKGKADLRNIPNNFKHTEQHFLNDVELNFGDSKGQTNILQVVNLLDFVLLNVVSTNSACENCFEALKALISGYQWEDKEPLKYNFLRFFFGEHNKDTPLHALYTSTMLSYRSYELTNLQKTPYKAIELTNNFDFSNPIFIHSQYEFPKDEKDASYESVQQLFQESSQHTIHSKPFHPYVSQTKKKDVFGQQFSPIKTSHDLEMKDEAEDQQEENKDDLEARLNALKKD